MCCFGIWSTKNNILFYRRQPISPKLCSTPKQQMRGNMCIYVSGWTAPSKWLPSSLHTEAVTLSDHVLVQSRISCRTPACKEDENRNKFKREFVSLMHFSSIYSDKIIIHGKVILAMQVWGRGQKHTFSSCLMRRNCVRPDQCLLSLTLAGVTVGEVHRCNRLLSRGNGPLCSCNLSPGHRHYTHCHTRHEYPAGSHGNRTQYNREEGSRESDRRLVLKYVGRSSI